MKYKHVLMAALTYNLKKFMKRPLEKPQSNRLGNGTAPIDFGRGLLVIFELIRSHIGLRNHPST
ncbi:MAG: hypothetical protein JKX84_04935 [Flavobacteriales bacterium]|nr:hypothetical protein [Flavobacteriales bacterium]